MRVNVEEKLAAILVADVPDLERLMRAIAEPPRQPCNYTTTR